MDLHREDQRAPLPTSVIHVDAARLANAEGLLVAIAVKAQQRLRIEQRDRSEEAR